MKQLAWLLRWVLKVAIFFTLFAFALNNQQTTTLNFFFGRSWDAPLVLVVLITFSAGVAIGVLGMVPRWWKHRRTARLLSGPAAAEPALSATSPPPHGL